MTIQDAWKRILEIRGERETLFTVEFWQYPHAPGKTEIQLRLWDGKANHYATTLDGIIKAAEESIGEPGVIDGELPEAIETKEGQADG